MGYYVKLYRGWTCVYTSEVFDSKAEAEKCAKDIEKDARQDPYSGIVTTSICQEQPTVYKNFLENAEDFCIGDYE